MGEGRGHEGGGLVAGKCLSVEESSGEVARVGEKDADEKGEGGKGGEREKGTAPFTDGGEAVGEEP